jgi:peptide/nickel transport system substrate-binding protein
LLNVATTASTVPARQAQPGGTATFLSTFEATVLDPAVNRGDTGLAGDAVHASLIFDQLLREDWQTTDVVPRIASSMTSSDGVTWLMKLRPNVKFSDGTPFDASAVKFNYNRIGDPATGSPYIATVQAMQSIDVVDPLTLRFVLKTPNVVFPRTISRKLNYIGSPTAIQAEGSQFGTAPVGAGAFIMKSWTRNSQMILNRNPSYWDSPRPYLDQVIIKQVPDNEQRFNTWQTGGGDISTVAQDPSYVDRAAKAGAYLQNYTTPVGGLDVFFNVSKAPFTDVRARQAVAQALDLDQLNKTAFSGFNTVTKSAIRAPSPYADPTINQLPYNPTQAQTLFNQVAADTGKPLDITITYSTTIGPLAEAVQGQLLQYQNVKVAVAGFAPAAISTKSATHDFQMILGSTTSFDPDDLVDQVVTGGTGNFEGYSNSQVDTAGAKSRSSFTQSDRMAALQTIQRQVYQDVPVFYLSVTPRVLYANPKVQDIQTNNGGINWESIWIQH